jgi:hypothetical protein
MPTPAMTKELGLADDTGSTSVSSGRDLHIVGNYLDLNY